MAEFHAMDGQQSESRKKIRWRRHSLSSAHSLSTQLQAKPQKDNARGSSTLDRAGHHSSSKEPSSKGHKTGGSFFRMFRSRSTKNSRMKRANSQELNAEKPILLEHKSDYIRVVATVLHPRIQYKTLPITEYTTAYEVVVKLVTKFATKEEDKDPDLFYLNEEHESEQGSYSRMLENNDRVHLTQLRWIDSNKKYSFVLCRKQRPLLDNSLLYSISAVVLSPSQDSFYNALPGLIAVEEGATPSSQTEHLMNAYFQPVSVPQKKQRGGNTKNGHLDGSRVDSIGNNASSMSAPAHTSTHSALPISPSELSAKEASMIEILSSSSHQLAPMGEGMMGRQPRNDSCNVNVGDQCHFPQPELQISNGSSSSKAKGETNYKQLMQRSLSQGMPGIMNKVISESKHNFITPTSAQNPVSSESRFQTGTATIHTDSDKQASVAPPLSGHVKPQALYYFSSGLGPKRVEKDKVSTESMRLKTLICSPMEAATRKFPEFVFASGADSQSRESGTTYSAKVSTGGGENRIQSSQMVRSNVSTSTVTENEGMGQLQKTDGSKGDTKSNSLARRLEFDYENDQTKSLKTARFHTRGQSNNKLDSNSTAAQSPPYAHHCTATRSVLPVVAETVLTIPFKYHCRASLYPSFLRSGYYSTEMDIMESLHTLLDMKFNQEKQQVEGSNHPTPSTESLMDEARKSHLIFSGETPKKANPSLKRPHSFHYRQTRSEMYRSAESGNLESPTKRELLMRKAAEAVKQRKKKNFSETESDLDTILDQQKNKTLSGRPNVTAMVQAIEQSSGRVQGSDNNYAQSMENLSMTNTKHSSALSGLSPSSQRTLSTSSYSLHALPSRPVSFREHPSSRTSSSYAGHRVALPRRSMSFHESSKNSQSLEALHIRSGPFSEEGDEELLYTFERKRRPVTVLVRSTSSLSVNQSQTGVKEVQSPRTINHSSNLTTMKAVSSQGLALSELAENQSNHLMFESAGAPISQKRFSRNRPTSAPTERPSQRANGGSSHDRESSGLEGLMNSIHLKADKLWWHEF